MKELINIHNIQFYHSSIPELIQYGSTNKCALIIDEPNLEKLISEGLEKVSGQVNQMIIISENLNACLPSLKDIDAFIVAANDFDQAVRFSIFSAELNKDVICVIEEDNAKSKELIELVVV